MRVVVVETVTGGRWRSVRLVGLALRRSDLHHASERGVWRRIAATDGGGVYVVYGEKHDGMPGFGLVWKRWRDRWCV